MWRCLWSLWKWILHLITGHCELYRLASKDYDLHQKTMFIVRSLRWSKAKEVRCIEKRLGLDVDVPTAVHTIIIQKAIKPAFQKQFVEQMTPCLMRVSGVKQLWAQAERLRAETYQQSNQDHEDMLMKLWSQLMVKQELTARISKQWQDIGFQGNNPATDFRGMGILGLHCLLYFSTHYCDLARSVLLHSKHPQRWYPWAIVGIDLTGQTYSWLKDGTLDTYLYSTCTQWPPPLTEFMEIFCYIVWKFDSFWEAERPQNVMAFPKVKAKFVEQFKSELDNNCSILHLKIDHAKN